MYICKKGWKKEVLQYEEIKQRSQIVTFKQTVLWEYLRKM